jgi:transcriptional regulator with XRE-family HTH domain
MTEITLDTTRLKAIRKARKIGRPKLSKLIGVSERAVAKLETSQSAAISQASALRLSDALQVPVQTLTGELPMIEDDLKPVEKSTCSNGCCG